MISRFLIIVQQRQSRESSRETGPLSCRPLPSLQLGLQLSEIARPKNVNTRSPFISRCVPAPHTRNFSLPRHSQLHHRCSLQFPLDGKSPWSEDLQLIFHPSLALWHCCTRDAFLDQSIPPGRRSFIGLEIGLMREQFLVLVGFTVIFDLYTLLFHYLSGFVTLITFLLLLLKVPIFLTGLAQLRERGGDLRWSQASLPFQGLSMGRGGQNGVSSRTTVRSQHWLMHYTAQIGVCLEDSPLVNLLKLHLLHLGHSRHLAGSGSVRRMEVRRAHHHLHLHNQDEEDINRSARLWNREAWLVQVMIQCNYLYVLLPYMPLLRSMVVVTSNTSRIGRSPFMKSSTSMLSSVPCRISRARLCEPPRGRDDEVDARSRGLWRDYKVA